ncbi:hypothetical protein HZH68_004051 [Vespula germanica]|uniref:Uncharacterized protein n=1 Tax=Vespula germanica TaxID=30212 RepID=A0A834NHV5_VESGE|nr:hypothetical protein HZH68_004051 [Vespula germanica]
MIAQCTNTLRGELEAFHRFPELRLEKHSKTHSRDLGRVLLRTLIRDKVFDGSSYLGNPMSLIHQGGRRINAMCSKLLKESRGLPRVSRARLVSGHSHVLTSGNVSQATHQLPRRHLLPMV